MIGRRQVARLSWSMACVLLVGCGFDRRPAALSQWAAVTVEMPVSNAVFPAGEGAEAATSYCLICHSAGMVLRQPPLAITVWRAEIAKMKSVYGAPIPDDQVEKIASYLAGLRAQPSSSSD